MIQLTDPAASILQEARDDQDLPDDYGVRISAQPDDEGELRVGLAFSEGPQDDDEIVEGDGLELYVAQEVAEALAQSVLAVGEVDGTEQLVIRPQESAE